MSLLLSQLGGAEAQTVIPGAIDSLEAFGTLAVHQHIHGTAIDSAEAFGTGTIVHHVEPSSITSAEAFGTLSIHQFIGGTGIPSDETFGTLDILANRTVGRITQLTLDGTQTQRYTDFAKPIAGQTLQPTAIDSAEAFGTPSIHLSITCASIDSTEAFGTPDVVNQRTITRITQLALQAVTQRRYGTFIRTAGGGGGSSIIDHSYRRGRGRR